MGRPLRWCRPLKPEVPPRSEYRTQSKVFHGAMTLQDQESKESRWHRKRGWYPVQERQGSHLILRESCATNRVHLMRNLQAFLVLLLREWLLFYLKTGVQT